MSIGEIFQDNNSNYALIPLNLRIDSPLIVNTLIDKTFSEIFDENKPYRGLVFGESRKIKELPFKEINYIKEVYISKGSSRSDTISKTEKKAGNLKTLAYFQVYKDWKQFKRMNKNFLLSISDKVPYFIALNSEKRIIRIFKIKKDKLVSGYGPIIITSEEISRTGFKIIRLKEKSYLFIKSELPDTKERMYVTKINILRTETKETMFYSSVKNKTPETVDSLVIKIDDNFIVILGEKKDLLSDQIDKPLIMKNDQIFAPYGKWIAFSLSAIIDLDSNFKKIEEAARMDWIRIGSFFEKLLAKS
ncbi:MAG: hypothetical protein JXA60_04625 [Candidatus Coatesbacteria bacterium]|nr:hypothetical protein [Candidatus Coatesbacteria bacterium]